MKKKKKPIFIGVGAVALIVLCYFVFEQIMYVSTDNAQIDGHFVMLAAKVGGYVTKVNIREGQRVSKDEILAEIDPRDYENTLQQMSGELTSIEAKKNDAEKIYRRMNELYSKGVVSQQQHDTSSATYADAKARWDAVSAQVAQAKLNLENTKIRAPADGFIAKKSVEIGQLASPGVPLVGFVEAHDRWITANFKETDLDRIHVGAKTSITVDAIGGRTYYGQVETISSATGATFTLLPPDNATGNFTKVVQRVPVRIRFNQLSDEDLKELRIGLSAYVKVAAH